MTKRIALLATLTLAALLVSPAPQAQATTLTPRVYLPFLVGGAAIEPPLPVLTMDLYIENYTGGELCYQILDVGPVECVRRQGERFYRAIPYGEYKFWGFGCIDQTYVLGRAPFMYRSATLFFSCAIFEGPIWAKMYEMR